MSDTDAVEDVIFGKEGAESALTERDDYCRLKHDFSFGDCEICRAGRPKRRGVGGCADDRIKNWITRWHAWYSLLEARKKPSND